MSQREWLDAAGMSSRDVPEKIILEGTWWHKSRYPMRLEYLTNVQELKFPDMYLGEYDGQKIMFCCAYGASRAVEPVHIFGLLGSKMVVQIGSCGSLQKDIKTGDVLIPTYSFIGEGASKYYGQNTKSSSTQSIVKIAQEALSSYGLRTHLGPHISTSALLQQSEGQIKEWQEKGLFGVDMETSAVFSAAEYFNMERVSLLFVWDELLEGRTWLHEFSIDEKHMQAKANQSIFEVALKI